MLNKISAILDDFLEQDGILRLKLRIGSGVLYALMLEGVEFAKAHYKKEVMVAFKESAITLALAIEGAQNAFKAEILEISTDKLFARLRLRCENAEITALAPLDFIEQNALSVKSIIFWHILESEVSLLV